MAGAARQSGAFDIVGTRSPQPAARAPAPGALSVARPDALVAPGAPAAVQRGRPASITPDPARVAVPVDYLESLSLVERLHRLLLDVIKDEFERLSRPEVTPVQALLLFNVGDNEVTAGELRSRGYYQGSNVSYNLKKLVDLGYLHHQRCPVDRRAVRIRLTPRGQELRDLVAALFVRHAGALQEEGMTGGGRLEQANDTLRRLERFWSDQIRFIY